MEKRLVLIKPVNRVYHGSLRKTSIGVPPIALGILAALTPRDWEITIIDENFSPFRYVEADLVGITAFTNTAPRAYEIARQYRERGVSTVMGGVHATVLPDEVRQHVDSVVVGEAEWTWGKVVEDFEAGKMEETYSCQWPELKNMPLPRYDLFPRRSIGAIQTTRGCPMNCHFCSVTAINGKRYRHRPVDEVLDELEAIPHKIVSFLDDNIVGHGKKNEERTLELFEGMIRRNLKKIWVAQASMNFADNETVMEYAAKSGCVLVKIGVEAESPEALKEMNKKVNLRTLKSTYQDAFRRIHEHGIAIHGYFMYGLDVDTPETLRQRTEFIKTCGVDAAGISIVCPFPGTELYASKLKEGRLRYTNFPDDWRYYHFENAVLEPTQMTTDELEASVGEAFREVYDRRAIWSRCMRTWRETKKLAPTLFAWKDNQRMRRMKMSMAEKPPRLLSPGGLAVDAG